MDGGSIMGILYYGKLKRMTLFIATNKIFSTSISLHEQMLWPRAIYMSSVKPIYFSMCFYTNELHFFGFRFCKLFRHSLFLHCRSIPRRGRSVVLRSVIRIRIGVIFGVLHRVFLEYASLQIVVPLSSYLLGKKFY